MGKGGWGRLNTRPPRVDSRWARLGIHLPNFIGTHVLLDDVVLGSILVDSWHKSASHALVPRGVMPRYLLQKGVGRRSGPHLKRPDSDRPIVNVKELGRTFFAS